MLLNILDSCYGNVLIGEKGEEILTSLLFSRPMQRLKKVHQKGVPSGSLGKSFSRYDHSVGVCILLRKLGASLEEQVAGLLHDVSHPAFSHVVDWLDGDSGGGEELYQDLRLADVIIRSEIGDILRRYNSDPQRISNHENFGLLERNMPDLCADRLDYAFREMSPQSVEYFLKYLRVVDGRIVFSSLAPATTFAREFLDLQVSIWGSQAAAVLYHNFARILKYAIRQKVITRGDLDELNDEEIFARLLVKGDSFITRGLSSLFSSSGLHVVQEPSRRVMKKFRHVDPLVVQKGGDLVRVSELDQSFGKLLEAERVRNEHGICIFDLFQ